MRIKEGKQCSNCGQYVRSLKQHMKEEHSGFTCSDCGEHFTTQLHLNRHKKTHTGKKAYNSWELASLDMFKDFWNHCMQVTSTSLLPSSPPSTIPIALSSSTLPRVQPPLAVAAASFSSTPCTSSAIVSTSLPTGTMSINPPPAHTTATVLLPHTSASLTHPQQPPAMLFDNTPPETPKGSPAIMPPPSDKTKSPCHTEESAATAALQSSSTTKVPATSTQPSSLLLVRGGGSPDKGEASIISYSSEGSSGNMPSPEDSMKGSSLMTHAKAIKRKVIKDIQQQPAKKCKQVSKLSANVDKLKSTPKLTTESVVSSVPEGQCIFCRSSQDDEQKLGKKMSKDGISIHYYCMLFASGLAQRGRDDHEGILGFLIPDIIKEVKRSNRLRCRYCKKPSAAIGCVKANCQACFHLGCGVDAGALNQFYNNFSSFCSEHRPLQVVPEQEQKLYGAKYTVCAICMCDVQASPGVHTLHTSCCKANSWYHRQCVQRMAMASGLHYCKCPLCNNKDAFQQEMLEFGIYIPNRDAEWELEPNAFQELLERHNQCDHAKCRCPRGRSFNKADTGWEVVLCDWCGHQGTHVTCGGLMSPDQEWVCEECVSITNNAVDVCPYDDSAKTKPVSTINETKPSVKRRGRPKINYANTTNVAEDDGQTPPKTSVTFKTARTTKPTSLMSKTACTSKPNSVTSKTACTTAATNMTSKTARTSKPTSLMSKTACMSTTQPISVTSKTACTSKPTSVTSKSACTSKPTSVMSKTATTSKPNSVTSNTARMFWEPTSPKPTSVMSKTACTSKPNSVTSNTDCMSKPTNFMSKTACMPTTQTTNMMSKTACMLKLTGMTTKTACMPTTEPTSVMSNAACTSTPTSVTSKTACMSTRKRTSMTSKTACTSKSTSITSKNIQPFMSRQSRKSNHATANKSKESPTASSSTQSSRLRYKHNPVSTDVQKECIQTWKNQFMTATEEYGKKVTDLTWEAISQIHAREKTVIGNTENQGVHDSVANVSVAQEAMKVAYLEKKLSEERKTSDDMRMKFELCFRVKFEDWNGSLQHARELLDEAERQSTNQG